MRSSGSLWVKVDGYEVFERFCIMAESTGDDMAKAYILANYGSKWRKWLDSYLAGIEGKTGHGK